LRPSTLDGQLLSEPSKAVTTASVASIHETTAQATIVIFIRITSRRRRRRRKSYSKCGSDGDGVIVPP
jgi:hypothetical protein